MISVKLQLISALLHLNDKYLLKIAGIQLNIICQNGRMKDM